MPLAMMYSYAGGWRPPLQPWLHDCWFSYSMHWWLQSTRLDSESEVSGLPARNHCPSVAPVVENAQHEPHWPWFLTGVTAPFETQFHEVGVSRIVSSDGRAATGALVAAGLIGVRARYMARNSSTERSAKTLAPKRAVLVRALSEAM
eukprot:Amastigsp_a339351_1019.p4 type:complete len:147 gc:universal Amastigsp_a339351_1019:644-204(-)